MSTGARIQFVRIDPPDHLRLTSWIHHISRLSGVPVDDAPLPEQPVFLWQLVAANHRVLARGATASVSADGSRADVAAVVSVRDRLLPRMVRLDESRGYGWLLLHDGEPRLACSRWYAMERDRREALRSARLGLEQLMPDPGADVAVRLIGTRSTR